MQKIKIGHRANFRAKNKCFKVIPLFCTAQPVLAHNIATSKMAAVLAASAERSNKGRFCRAKAVIRNNKAANRLTASWPAIKKLRNEKNLA